MSPEVFYGCTEMAMSLSSSSRSLSFSTSSGVIRMLTDSIMFQLMNF